jgi:hypothetical protein
MADEKARSGGKPRAPRAAAGAPKPEELHLKIAEVHDAVKGLHERLDVIESARVVCNECGGCGPCFECWNCRPTVCRPTVCRPTVCRPTVCRVCEKCFECSCGPCAE